MGTKNKQITEPYSLEQVRTLVAQTVQQKKLDAWKEKSLNEETLPKLYWLDNGEQLTSYDVRFLLYQVKQSPIFHLNFDTQQFLAHIDRSSSKAFATVLLKAFEDSNSDMKLLTYMELAVLLSGEDMLSPLHSLLRKSIENKRSKLSRFLIDGLAEIGTDKALRIIEGISRKYTSKSRATGLAAEMALNRVAGKSNLTVDELADRIIPNFDFDGLYKTVEVNGHEYRVFINIDFKLAYLTEDNTLRKSLPSGVSKELKAALKEIEKEVKEVSKNQNGRLEKYMVEERRWPINDWQTFFFNNPIMFVYALKLLWGVYDSSSRLLTIFYCSDDMSLYDIQDNDVVVEDGQFVGIIHPIQLTEQALNSWREKVYELGLVTIFPILERPVFRLSDSEQHATRALSFNNTEIARGGDFANNFLSKRNWQKSVVDSGALEFHKLSKDGLFSAHADISGLNVRYQGAGEPAIVYAIVFRNGRWGKEVPLNELPPLFYSEVLADIHQMINN